MAQKLTPPIYNYEIFEYKGASQNWGMDVGNDGELFVANNKGLLYFNGEEWALNKLPNNTIVRAVKVINKRIFTGSYEEFGYWERNNTGQLEYTRLTHLIKDHEFTSEEFWQILSYRDKIIFRSFSGVYIYQNENITVLDTDIIVTDIVVFEDRIIIASDNKGLFELIDNKLISYADHELLENKTIIDMISLDEGLLIGTKLHGCFLFKDNQLLNWGEPINSELEQYQLNKIQLLANNKIIFGTIKNGIYIYNISSQTFEHLNREKGLQNNTVLSLQLYKDQLWIGLDNGIDRVLLNSPIQYYTDYSGAVGTVYDIAELDDIVYLGSNTGIYFVENNTLQFVNGSQGHVWDMEVLEGQLLCGHNTGTYSVDKGNLRKTSSFSGGYKIAKIPESKDTFLQGTYTGLIKYQKEKDDSWNVSRVTGINFPVRQLCFEDPYIIWVAHPYKGFFRLKINKQYDQVLSIKEFHTGEVADDYSVKLYKIKNQIVLNSKETWYKYNPISDKIELFQEFQDFNDKELVYFDKNHFAFIDNADVKKIIYTNLKSDTLTISENQLSKRLIPDAEKITQSNDSLHLLTLSDGYAEINFSKLQDQLSQVTIPKPKLYAFKGKEVSYSLSNGSPEISFKDSRDIIIKVASPGVVESAYQYELTGSSSLLSYTEDGILKFQNLPHGEYQLHIHAIGINGKKSKPTTIRFEITPPWYLSFWCIVGYILTLTVLFLLYRKYNDRKIQRKQDELRKHLEREQHQRIAALEKERLVKEVKSKQKELASTTMNVAKKNQIILELKDMLLTNKDKFSHWHRYKFLLKKVDDSINITDDWKRFEFSFKELHEDFFEKLLKQYPDLTPKDLKLCAYLKMNLSSKEIAPLMAITIRGVEIHRYRLRKKLKIDGTQNLSNFLITFQ